MDDLVQRLVLQLLAREALCSAAVWCVGGQQLHLWGTWKELLLDVCAQRQQSRLGPSEGVLIGLGVPELRVRG